MLFFGECLKLPNKVSLHEIGEHQEKLGKWLDNLEFFLDNGEPFSWVTVKKKKPHSSLINILPPNHLVIPVQA